MTQVSFKEGDIFQSGCDVLVNPVNCKGIAGAGLALEFKKRYAGTGMMAFYQRVCEMGTLRPGARPIIWRAPQEICEWKDSPRMTLPSVLLFPTKLHWRDKSNLNEICSSLVSMQSMIYPDFSIAFPKIGCGLGSLDYESDLRPVFEELLPLLSFDSIVIHI